MPLIKSGTFWYTWTDSTTILQFLYHSTILRDWNKLLFQAVPEIFINVILHINLALKIIMNNEHYNSSALM